MFNCFFSRWLVACSVFIFPLIVFAQADYSSILQQIQASTFEMSSAITSYNKNISQNSTDIHHLCNSINIYLGEILEKLEEGSSSSGGSSSGGSSSGNGCSCPDYTSILNDIKNLCSTIDNDIISGTTSIAYYLSYTQYQQLQAVNNNLVDIKNNLQSINTIIDLQRVGNQSLIDINASINRLNDLFAYLPSKVDAIAFDLSSILTYVQAIRSDTSSIDDKMDVNNNKLDEIIVLLQGLRDDASSSSDDDLTGTIYKEGVSSQISSYEEGVSSHIKNDDEIKDAIIKSIEEDSVYNTKHSEGSSSSSSSWSKEETKSSYKGSSISEVVVSTVTQTIDRYGSVQDETVSTESQHNNWMFDVDQSEVDNEFLLNGGSLMDLDFGKGALTNTFTPITGGFNFWGDTPSSGGNDNLSFIESKATNLKDKLFIVETGSVDHIKGSQIGSSSTPVWGVSFGETEFRFLDWFQVSQTTNDLISDSYALQTIRDRVFPIIYSILAAICVIRMYMKLLTA